ncbi:hypothetical protein GCM10011491_01500 [Brucella endophytica]|uniref:Tail assembly chaperone n=1 Tax=Brucella endophytica TaxID=1963359 RepID=A0A916W9E7_9HYPH|nr:hypothetical protein [Brucella endophytica]GGA78016.1 hypothetical protein GCM10011491_01500 [Brucella endophytica]
MTYQRPAYEKVTIAHGGSTVTLRPSLRAAVTLEARFGFQTMFRALAEGNFSIISEIILTATDSRDDAAAFLLSEAAGRPLSSFIGIARIPLAELVSMLMPAPVQQLDTTMAAPSGKAVAWADFYADQYEKATGWLGWTPEQAWNATPTEIDRAYSGHIAKLKAVHGSSDDDKQPTPKKPDPEQAARNVAEGLDPEFDRAGLRALKAKIAGGA